MRFVPSLRLEIALNIKYISILFLYSVFCIMFRTEVELHYIQTIMSVQGAMDISEEDHY